MRSPSEVTQAPFVRVDHVQLSIPAGEEERARRFYTDLLGLREVPRPPEMAHRGGGWFSSGGVSVHLAVEEPFAPAKRAHPAFVCSDYEHLLERLGEHDVAVIAGEPSPERKARCHITDPFGNRIELIAL